MDDGQFSTLERPKVVRRAKCSNRRMRHSPVAWFPIAHGDACGREKSNILIRGGVAGSKGSRKPVDRTPPRVTHATVPLKRVDHLDGGEFLIAKKGTVVCNSEYHTRYGSS
ncbi:hypothetical protein RUM43_007204 [Polyplax serrata]|uniref:Uncharacterized protein n=1 Tax=Polyplax serrata TaxID=468196 RepID=A0AAN8P1J3_POLSC